MRNEKSEKLNITRSHAKKLCDDGNFFLNGKAAKANKILKVGDIYLSADKAKTVVLFDIPNSEFIRERIEQLIHDTNEASKKSSFYANNKECGHCGSYYEANLHKCPMCGAPSHKK